MKQKALHHLMLDRARHIRVHGEEQIILFLDDVEDSLTVDFDKGLYTITWRYHNESHQIDMRHDSFKFYIRGDLGKPPTLRDVRRGNWEAALDLWRQIADRSGQAWPETIEESQNSMGLDLSPPLLTPQKLFFKNYGVIALVTFLAGFFTNGLGYGVSVMLGGVALAFLSRERDGLRRAPWPQKINDWFIVLSAAIIPSFFNYDGLFSLSLLIVCIACLHVTEKYRPLSRDHWLGFFGLAALIAACAGSTGLGGGVILFAMLFAICAIVLPARFDKNSVLIGCGVLALGGIWGMEQGYGVDMTLLIWPLVIMFAIMSGIGWFIGELFVLGPWLIHGFLGFVALGALITGDTHMAASITIATGFALAEFIRMISAFRGTKAAPIIKPEGAV